MKDYGMVWHRGILHTEYNEYDSIIKPMHLAEVAWCQVPGGHNRDRHCDQRLKGRDHGH